MQDDLAIKSCPCCGGTARLTAMRKTGAGFTAWVTCEECGLTTKIYDDIEDAVLAWNAREQEADYEQRNDVNVCR